jgi:hypothetical protein
MVDLTPAVIVKVLGDIGKEIDGMPGVIEALDEQEVTAKATFDREYRAAFLTSEGAMDLRKVIADEAAADSKLQYELAGVRLRAAKENLRVLRDRLEIGRSLGSIMKMEWGNS